VKYVLARNILNLPGQWIKNDLSMKYATFAPGLCQENRQLIGKFIDG